MTKTKNKPIKSSLAKRNLQKFMKNRMAIIGAIGFILIIGLCICAPLLTPHDPSVIDMSKRPLSYDYEAAKAAGHPWGVDRMGRDLMARILYGGRISIMLGVLASVCVNILGASLGAISGYFGGKVDKVLVVIQEFMSMFPTTIILMLFRGFVDGGVVFLICLWTFTGWGGSMRIIRSRILSLKQEPFIESCRANGISSLSIMFHHMIPNTMGPINVNVTMNIGGYIMAEAGLSFIGLGVPSEVPTWGNIVNAANRLDIIQQYPRLWVLPGLAIGLIVLCGNFFGDGLRDALDSTTK